MAPRFRFDLALLTLSAIAIFCVKSSKAQATGNYSDLSVLPLPDPELVNDFLLEKYPNWTNPVLGGQGRQPLQVTKCQSLPLGATFDFYQVQPPRKTCELPPPLVSSTVHRKHIVSANIDWLIYYCVYLSLVWGVTFAAFFGLMVVFLIVGLGHMLAGRGNEPLPQGFFKPYAWVLLAAIVASLVPIGFLTGSAAHCLWPKTRSEYKGPVSLPDPNQGLNQYLASKLGEGSPILQLCTTDNLAFCTGFSTSCARVGEPYGELKPDVPKAEHDAHPCSKNTKELLSFCLVLGGIGTGIVWLIVAVEVYRALIRKLRSLNITFSKPRVTPVSSVGEDEADAV